MNLVAYTVTALSRNDITDTPKDANVLAGAIIELKDYSGNLITIYDDGDGTNPETQKTCNSDGQRTIWAESGDYVLEIDGKPQYVSFGVSLSVLNSAVDDAELEIGNLVLEASSEADRAEAAADAAGLNAGVYQTIAEGISATVSGDYFSVSSDNDNSYLDLYKNESGVAVFKKSYPSTEKVRSLEDEVNRFDLIDYAGGNANTPVIIDGENRVIQSIRSNGSIDGDFNTPEKDFFKVENVAGYSGNESLIPLIIDAANRVVLGTTKEGRIVGDFSGTSESTDKEVESIRSISGMTRIDGEKIVVSGDSLSFNNYGFGFSDSQAMSSYPGLGSWSFLLRDAIHRNDPFFKSPDDLEVTHNATISTNPGVQKYILPFNGICTKFNPVDSSSFIEFDYGHIGGSEFAYLHTVLTTSNTNSFVDVYVDDVLVVSSFSMHSDSGDYKGVTPSVIKIPLSNDGVKRTIKITNITGDITGFNIFGISSKYTEYNITGSGGKTSAWMLDNLTSRVLNYDPDVFICMITANDFGQEDLTVGEITSNISNIIDACRTHNDKMQIVMMMPPYGVDILTTPEMRDEIDAAVKSVCKLKEVHFFSCVNLFKQTDINNIYYDQIHFNKRGNTILANAMVNFLCLDLINNELIDSNINYFSGVPTL